MKKAKLILLAGLAIAVSLTGCQKKEVKPGDVAGYDEGEQYLSIWVHSIEDTLEGQVYRESVDSFNEKYNGKYFADIEFIPRNDSGGGYSDKVNSSVLSGGLPDVLTLDGPNVAAYAENGIIQPLAELTEEERGEYLESILDQGTYNDKLYALGVMESSVGLYYNKDILEEAGIEVPDADHPWTQTEFMDILAKLKPLMDEKNGYPIDMTFPVGEASIYYYAPFIWANGGNLVSEDGLTVDGYFNSEKNVEVMNYFHQIVENKYMSEAPIENLFESGRAAFKFDGAWEVNTIYENYPDVNLGVAPYVVGDDWDGERYTPTGSWAFAASSETDNIEGATELVKWMSGVESGVRIWNEAKSLPSTYKAFEQIDVFQTDENYKALYEQLSKYGHPRPKTPVYPQVKWLHEHGVAADVIIGGRSKELIILEEQMKAVAGNLYITTDDGSYGSKGVVTNEIQKLVDAGNKYDVCVAIGPMIMMKFVCKLTKELEIPTVVSLNPIMVDGTGMCGACRVTVGGEVKFACVDGPEFDGHLVNFEEAMERQQIYKTQEGRAYLAAKEGDTHHGGCGQCGGDK